MDEHHRLPVIDFPRLAASGASSSSAGGTGVDGRKSASNSYSTAVINSAQDYSVSTTNNNNNQHQQHRPSHLSMAASLSSPSARASTSSPPRRGSFSSDTNINISSSGPAALVAPSNNEVSDEYYSGSRRSSRVASNESATTTTSSNSGPNSNNNNNNNSSNSSSFIGSLAVSGRFDDERFESYSPDDGGAGSSSSPRVVDRAMKDNVTALSAKGRKEKQQKQVPASSSSQRHQSMFELRSSSSFEVPPLASSINSSSSSTAFNMPPVVLSNSNNSAVALTAGSKNAVASASPLSVSRRSSQASSGTNENNGHPPSSSQQKATHHLNSSSHYGQQHALVTTNSLSSNTLPSSHQQQNSGNNAQQLNQLQTEISIKDELLKHQTVHLVETHRRQAELEEQLAFFKIDAKFDSVANILLKNRIDSYSADHQPSSIATAANFNDSSISPLPSAPYIGKSPFKVVLCANTLNPTAADSSDRSTPGKGSMLNIRDSFTNDTFSPAPRLRQFISSAESSDREFEAAAAPESTLIVGLSKELSGSLRQLSDEIHRISSECANLRKNSTFETTESDSGNLIKSLSLIEHSTDRLDDDIEICRSRLGKLRADVPAQLTGSLSVSSVFDSLYASLEAARSDLNQTIRLKDELWSPNHHHHQQHQQQLSHSKPPLYGNKSNSSSSAPINSNEITSAIKPGMLEPSPLFMAALADLSSFPMTTADTTDSSSANKQHQQGQEDSETTQQLQNQQQPFRFGANRFLQEQHRFLKKSDSSATSNTDDDSAEALTRELLSRLTSGEQIASSYKAELDSLKARLDTLTPVNATRPVTPTVPLSYATPQVVEPPVAEPVNQQQPSLEETHLNDPSATMALAPFITSTPKTAPVKDETVTERPPHVKRSVTNQSLASSSNNNNNSNNNCSHQICAVSFDAAAAAYKTHLHGLDRRLDNHESFVLNAFGSLLDKYIIQQPIVQQPPAVQAFPVAPQPIPPTTVVIEKRVFSKARATQVTVSDEEEVDGVGVEVDRGRMRRRSTANLKHSYTDSNLKQKSEEAAATEYSKNFEQIVSQLKTDIQDIKQSFLQTAQTQQQQQVQQMSQLQKDLSQQRQLEMQQLQQQQQQLQMQLQQHQQQRSQRDSTPPPPSPPTQHSESRRHHVHVRRSRQSSQGRLSPRSSHMPTDNASQGDFTAFSGIIAAAEETLATLNSNRAHLTEQVNQLEIKRMNLEEEIARLTLECNQVASTRDQIRDNSLTFESQIHSHALDLANKQQELAVIDEMISDGRKVLGDLNMKTGELQTKFDLLQSTAEQHRLGLEAVATRTSIAKQELCSLEEKLFHSKNELTTVEQRLSERHHDLKVIHENINAARAECEAITREREEFLEQSTLVLSEHSALHGSLSALAAERDGIVAQLEHARDGLLVLEARSLTKQQEADACQRRYEDMAEMISALKQRREILQRDIDSNEKRLFETQAVLEDAAERRRLLKGEVDSLQAMKSDLTGEVESLKATVVRLTAEVKGLSLGASNEARQQAAAEAEGVRNLERKLADVERQLADEKTKSSNYELLARERQDEVGRLVGQLLVVHADYLNLHRQLRRMNAAIDEQRTDQSTTAHGLAASYHYDSRALSAGAAAAATAYFRESSPDLVVSGSQGLKLSERPSSSGSGHGSNASGVGSSAGSSSASGLPVGLLGALGGPGQGFGNLNMLNSNPLSPTKQQTAGSSGLSSFPLFDESLVVDPTTGNPHRRTGGPSSTGAGSQRSGESGYSSIA